MGLMPDKPNPVRRSIAAPREGTRVCTGCFIRQDDTAFRWLWKGTRKASQCKRCEKRPKTAAKPLFAVSPTLAAAKATILTFPTPLVLPQPVFVERRATPRRTREIA